MSEEFDQLMQPLRAAPVRPAMPQPQEQQGGGLVDFFKSLFYRQSDLDRIMEENGLRGGAQPATGGVRG